MHRIRYDRPIIKLCASSAAWNEKPLMWRSMSYLNNNIHSIGTRENRFSILILLFSGQIFHSKMINISFSFGDYSERGCWDGKENKNWALTIETVYLRCFGRVRAANHYLFVRETGTECCFNLLWYVNKLSKVLNSPFSKRFLVAARIRLSIAFRWIDIWCLQFSNILAIACQVRSSPESECCNLVTISEWGLCHIHMREIYFFRRNLPLSRNALGYVLRLRYFIYISFTSILL